MREKLSLYCNVPVKAVIEEQNVESSIYELPLMLRKEHVDDLVVDMLRLKAPRNGHAEWSRVVRRIKNPRHHARIGIVGKYIELQDAYKSVYESLQHAGIANNCAVEMVRIDSKDLEKPGGRSRLRGLDGILVPGGFGDRGTSGKIEAARFARVNEVPYYGLCLGLQIAVIEFSRNVLGLKGANSAEFDAKTPHPVIDIMEEQKAITDKGATMRLGSYECALTKGTLARKAYGTESVRERHRHRFEVNNAYLDQLAAAGMVVSGRNPKRNLVEIVELRDHPWFLAVQVHPEFQSKPNRAHPLFAAFVKAAIAQRAARKGKSSKPARKKR
jgi:CTP synthase